MATPAEQLVALSRAATAELPRMAAAMAELQVTAKRTATAITEQMRPLNEALLEARKPKPAKCRECGQLVARSMGIVSWHMPRGWYELPPAERVNRPCPGSGWSTGGS